MNFFGFEVGLSQPSIRGKSWTKTSLFKDKFEILTSYREEIFFFRPTMVSDKKAIQNF